MVLETAPKSVNVVREVDPEGEEGPELEAGAKIVLESPPPVREVGVAPPDLPSEDFAGPVPSDFVSEELPPDFWDEPTPHDEPPSRPARPAPPPPLDNNGVDKERPLFDQLKQLFPGRVVRVDPLAAQDGETLTGETGEDGAGEDVVQDSLFD